MPDPLTRWQRFVAMFLPWYTPREQDERLAKSERLVSEVREQANSGRERVRQAYRATDKRVNG